MKLTVNDRHSISLTNSRREYTDEGFLKVPGRAARTGTQEYLASELGITDRKPNDIIVVYRPPEEVFNADSLTSYDGVDITIEHPKGLVSSDTYKQVSVGHVRGAAVQDGDFTLIDMIVKDKDAINKIESGKVQLSAGYTAIYDKAPDDSPYDYIQREIKINHVALVDRARAGAQARLFDNQPREKTMIKISLDSGRDVEIEDKATASLVEDSIQRLTQRVTDAEAKVESTQAVVDSLNEQLEEAKKASSDEAIAERVEAIAKTLDDARKIAGKEFTTDSLDPIEIQRAALAQVRKNVDWTGKSAAYVQAAFDMGMEKETDDEDDEDEKESNDSYRQLAKDGANDKVEQPKPSPVSAFADSLTNAWKKGE